jgi:hypothetical protein
VAFFPSRAKLAGPIVTGAYSLAPAAGRRQPVRLLLTSDHQLKAMTPANLAKVAETVGYEQFGVQAAAGGDHREPPRRRPYRAVERSTVLASPERAAAKLGRSAGSSEVQLRERIVLLRVP